MIDAALAEAFEASWPAAETARAGGFLVGRGLGAGGRVSSARVAGAWAEADIAAAEAVHEGWGQRAVFRVCDTDAALIRVLAARGYAPEIPTLVLEAEARALAEPPLPVMRCFAVWPPLAVQRQIWAEGNITPARQAVMARVALPKAAILARIADRAAGAGFVAALREVAMLHGIEVVPAFRRKGVGAWIVRQAAEWADGQGASRLALAVSRANAGALALYDRLGFREAGSYAYYARPA
ncbi:GNAT family N-acetyltransferase [Paracoccus tibetensis]|uniref:Acetyltransferase (GNAT) family protein n=1 Tax=Paracoccus tibetensis TaxID=336292 RepID=A0A1G5INW8_9RHOB|nr:GNAT family N-acetyltransferase [Paracoccus tibetensis]SCY77451.1 Acetyltransferase (GNAT) family protein [Paracoccus tibetensis]